MANLFADTSSAVYNLMQFYKGPIKDNLNEEVPLYQMADTMKYNWSGQQVQRPLRLQRNQGIGAGSDGGPLPSIGRQGGTQATILAKYNWLRFGLTAGILKASQNDKGSFVRQFQFEMEMGMKDLKSDLNRQISWDGTGTLAQINTTVAGSTTVVISGRESGEPARKFVDVGLVFDIYTTGGALVQSGISVTAVSGGPLDATATLTTNTAVTATSGNILVRANSKTYEVQGLLTALDGGTSTIYGVDRSVYVQYQGNVSTVSGQLTLDALQGAQNAAEQRGGAKIKYLYSDYNARRYYQKLLTIDKRYVNATAGDGGFAKASKYSLEWNGCEWISDKDCPQRIFLLPDDVWEKAVLCEMEPAEETGSAYIAQAGVDAWEVRVRHFFNCFNAMPAGCAVLTSYTSP